MYVEVAPFSEIGTLGEHPSECIWRQARFFMETVTLDGEVSMCYGSITRFQRLKRWENITEWSALLWRLERWMGRSRCVMEVSLVCRDRNAGRTSLNRARFYGDWNAGRGGVDVLWKYHLFSETETLGEHHWIERAFMETGTLDGEVYMCYGSITCFQRLKHRENITE